MKRRCKFCVARTEHGLIDTWTDHMGYGGIEYKWRHKRWRRKAEQPGWRGYPGRTCNFEHIAHTTVRER